MYQPSIKLASKRLEPLKNNGHLIFCKGTGLRITKMQGVYFLLKLLDSIIMLPH